LREVNPENYVTTLDYCFEGDAATWANTIQEWNRILAREDDIIWPDIEFFHVILSDRFPEEDNIRLNSEDASFANLNQTVLDLDDAGFYQLAKKKLLINGGIEKSFRGSSNRSLVFICIMGIHAYLVGLKDSKAREVLLSSMKTDMGLQHLYLKGKKLSRRFQDME
jgi:hypothetical protein